MPITHNQINRFWSNPTYLNFKKSVFNKKLFIEEDANLCLKIGAYLIEDARKYSETHTAWDESEKYDIWKNPILENINYAIGAEYLMKGVFLKNGFAINIPKPSVTGLLQPIKLQANKGKLSKTEVQTIDYVVRYISIVVDFTEFDATQKQDKDDERAKDKGTRLQGITSMGIPHPSSRQLLEYIHYKRNYSLHRPFIATEFSGITKQLFDFMDYIATKGAGQSLESLARLTNR